uniref:Uncharacterized protein n=1 Tax=Glossina austeni TaxID=7395 RepID=A0A1A9VD16_GLOAU
MDIAQRRKECVVKLREIWVPNCCLRADNASSMALYAQLVLAYQRYDNIYMHIVARWSGTRNCSLHLECDGYGLLCNCDFCDTCSQYLNRLLHICHGGLRYDNIVCFFGDIYVRGFLLEPLVAISGLATFGVTFMRPQNKKTVQHIKEPEKH